MFGQLINSGDICIQSCHFGGMVMFISFRTDIMGGTVQTPQSDQGLHCLQFILYFYNAFFCGKISMLTLRIITAYFYGILKFKKITVYQ